MADYTFTIKTPAELSGVEQAVQRFEELRGKAKANGSEFEVLDQKIAAAKASIEAYRTSLVATAPAAAKVADDSERYAAALEKLQSTAHEARAEEAQRQIDLRNTTKITVEAGEKTVEANAKSGRAAGEHETKITGLNKALGLLARVGGETGQKINALYQLSGNALTLGIAAGSVVVSNMISKWRAWREEIATTKAQLEQIEWSKFSSAVDGVKNAYIELSNFNAAIRDAGKPQDSINQSFDEQLAVLDAEIEKKKNLLKLNEELEISKARARLGDVTEEEIESAKKEIHARYAQPGGPIKGAASKRREELEDVEKNLRDKKKEELEAIEKQIRARYGSIRAGLETDADRKTLQELQKELALRQGKAAGLQQAAEDLKRSALGAKNSPIAAEASAQVELLGGKDGVVEKLRAKSQAAQKAADSWSWRDLFSGDDIMVRQQRADAARTELETKAAELVQWRSLQTKFAADQQDLDKTANDALGEFTQNETAITRLKQQISKRQKVDPIKESMRATESMLGLQKETPADQFLLAVAGANNIQSGERATPDQAKAINQVGKLHGYSGSNFAHLIKTLDGLFDHQERLSAALQRYEARLSKLKKDSSDRDSRVQDSYNR